MANKNGKSGSSDRFYFWGLQNNGVENPPANTGAVGSISESGGSCGVGNDNPFQYSCLENSMERGDWRATVYDVSKS